MTLEPGATLGRYQIVDQLGQGGMATVYKAYQPALERVVALKVIRPGFAEDREFLERFTREAKAIARLAHPNIVQVFDFDQVGGRYVIAVQYLEGGTLKARLGLAVLWKVLPQEEVVRILRQVAEALGYAHARGVVHRPEALEHPAHRRRPRRRHRFRHREDHRRHPDDADRRGHRHAVVHEPRAGAGDDAPAVIGGSAEPCGIARASGLRAAYFTSRT